jgi:hypothetical protein
MGVDMPLSLKPVYSTWKSNQNVLLHRGRLRLTRGDSAAEGPGTVRLSWLPVPSITYRLFPEDAVPGVLEAGEATLSLLGPGRNAPVFSHGMSMRSGTVLLEGTLRGSLEPNKSVSMTRVVFHVVGFLAMNGELVQWRTKRGQGWTNGRVRLRGGGWEITLDAVSHLHGPDGLTGGLDVSRGFGITHVGQIQREDRNRFTPEEADEILTDLGCYLSFARGAWCMPILPVGFKDVKTPCWDDWRLKRLSRYTPARTWCNTETTDALRGAFPGFLLRRSDPVWRKPVEIAINWYVESCGGLVTVDTGLVIEQTALEMVAWVLFVEDQKSYSANDFENPRKHPASSKIGRLLDWAGISRAVPAPLPDLAALAARTPVSARDVSACDGPQIFANLRNKVAHAKSGKGILSIDTKSRGQAAHLGTWYIGLLLLRLFDYTGEYFNDLSREGTVELVPWAAPGKK